MRATKKYYDLPFAGYCGVFLEEHVMKKAAKLMYKHSQEIKELLQANIDSIECSNWTLAHPNGKQESIYYIGEKWQTKEQRIALIDKTNVIKRIEHVYLGSAEDAKNEHMKLYDGNTGVLTEVADEPTIHTE